MPILGTKASERAEARDALGRYEAVVRALARRLVPVARFGHALDHEDLCAEGRIAVLEALRTYAGFGIEERTWVRTRIRQRMIDAIRRLDVRTRDEVRTAVEQDKVIARGGEVTTESCVRRLISLDATFGDFDSCAPLADVHALAADELADQSAQHERLRDALTGLPPRQREAIELGLYEGLPLREIGDRMGISESRVCQLQKRAVQHLQRVVSVESLSAA